MWLVALEDAVLAQLHCQWIHDSEIYEVWANSLFYWKHTAKLPIFVKGDICFESGNVYFSTLNIWFFYVVALCGRLPRRWRWVAAAHGPSRGNPCYVETARYALIHRCTFFFSGEVMTALNIIYAKLTTTNKYVWRQNTREWSRKLLEGRRWCRQTVFIWAWVFGPIIEANWASDSSSSSWITDPTHSWGMFVLQRNVICDYNSYRNGGT